MKKSLAYAACAAFVVFAPSAIPQTTETNLEMSARWDNGRAMQGTVTFGKVNLSGPDTVLATQALSRGRATISQVLAANTVYDVTLVSSDGSQIVKFPVTTALINPNNLQRAEIDLVCHASDHTLASARIDVSMAF
ncbi:MAG TPA: hypothetical protein VJN93_04610 [Candidatus Acidoferrum sp.]|nr:hypothetical protein [Candidatus Acidoferrum sp.]